MKLDVGKNRFLFEEIYKLSQELEMEVYPVGGYVRDLYLGKEVTDIDFVVVGDGIAFAHAFSERMKAGKVVSYNRFGTAMVNYQEYKLEFVTARSEIYEPDSRKPQVEKADLKSDLSRRDFTINTLALHISPEKFGELIDVYQAVEAIEKRIIETPLDPVVTFADDPLRIMRAVRFATVLNFDIAPRTREAIIQTRERLSIISQERITEEMKKMIMAPRPSLGFWLMKELGLLPIVFPEMELLGGVDQRQDYHHKDVFDHTLKVLDNVAKLTDKFELRLAAIFHDIAKPQTKRFVDEVGWTFHGHEELGARMVGRIGRRMRLPIQTIKYVQKLVRLHLRPMQLVEDHVTDSAIRRLMVEAGEELDDLMLLCRCDITSHNPRKIRQFLANFDRVEEKMKIVEEKDKLRTFKPAITGEQIMEALNLTPGPLVGKIKKAVTDAVLDGDIPNEPEACFQYMMKIKDQFLSS
ncbi:MAG: HD domain-containing protein [Calditrichia bacterium]